jgi:cation transport ATPase
MGAAGTDAAVKRQMCDHATTSGSSPWLIRLGRRTLRIIRVTALSLAAKAVFVTLAVLGYATLWMAGGGYGYLLAVILNGMRPCGTVRGACASCQR